MARYLFVCGGAGKALVEQSDTLGFDGVMQIDIPQEIVSIDMRTVLTQVMAIPVPQDVMTKHEAMHAAKQELSARCDALQHHTNHLAQQPTVVEFVALRDACSSAYTQYKQQVQDVSGRHTHDEFVQHIKDIREFRYAQPRLVQLEENNAEVKAWLRLHEEIAVLQARLKTYQIGVDGTYNGSLFYSAHPLIWNAYFGRSYVKDVFYQHVNRLLSERFPPVGEYIEIWIVSSMCGGVGQGITYHVAEYANAFFKARGYQQTSIQFARIGAVTYQQYSPDHATTCAMALLHDTALAYGVRSQMDVRMLLGEAGYLQQQRTQYNFYYLELPEYPEVVKIRRAYDLVMAFRTITNTVFRIRFDVAFVNARPGWHRAMSVRFGMWQTATDGRTGSSASPAPLLYPQTAEQVLSEINALLYPNRVSLDATCRHSIQHNKSLERWLMTPEVVEQMSPTEFRKRWSRIKSFLLPSYVQLYQKSAPNERDITDFVHSEQCEAAMAEIQRVIATYIGEHMLREFEVALFTVHGEMGEDFPQLVTFSTPDKSRPEYITELRHAQSALAKIDRILSSGRAANYGSFAQLYAYWTAIVPSIFESNRSYELKLRSGIKPLVESWITVRTLLNLRHSAEQRIHHARIWLEPLRQHLQRDLAVLGNRQHEVLATICDLAKPFKTMPHTWLYAMADAQKHYEQVAQTSHAASARAEKEYQTTVNWGAQQLTRDGLVYVLKSSSQVSLSHFHFTIQDIVDEMSAHCGRNPEGIWWQRQVLDGATRNPMMDFAYVILPWLDPDLYQQIINTPASPGLIKPDIIMVDIEEIGLVACALQAYRGVDEWFPQEGTPFTHSYIYATLMHLLARRPGESVEAHQHRVALASTGLPVYMTNHIRTLTGNALAGVVYEVGAEV